MKTLMNNLKNTRFNPTTNGPLHLGHLYMILLNYNVAKSAGGKFIVRFDDDQTCFSYPSNGISKAVTDEITNEMIATFEWLGIIPDSYSSVRSRRESVREKTKNLECLNFGFTDEYCNLEEWIEPIVVGTNSPYPYIPYITARKVILDYEDGCDPIIRGDDLVDEFSLYCYFCKLLNQPIPKLIFVPRMLQSDGHNVSDMSKTEKTISIMEYKEMGYTPEELIDIVSSACLIDKDKGWQVSNIKKQPINNLTSARLN